MESLTHGKAEFPLVQRSRPSEAGGYVSWFKTPPGSMFDPKEKSGMRTALLVSALLLGYGIAVSTEARKYPSRKISAQRLVEQTLAAHYELLRLKLASTPPGSKQCLAIASNEKKGIGEKCDNDGFTAMRRKQPFVEKKKGAAKRCTM